MFPMFRVLTLLLVAVPLAAAVFVPLFGRASRRVALVVSLLHVGLTETKSPSNPLGIKGCGEAGAIAAPAAVINAITDALGTEDIAMPATANAVWAAMQRTSPKAA